MMHIKPQLVIPEGTPIQYESPDQVRENQQEKLSLRLMRPRDEVARLVNWHTMPEEIEQLEYQSDYIDPVDEMLAQAATMELEESLVFIKEFYEKRNPVHSVD